MIAAASDKADGVLDSNEIMEKTTNHSGYIVALFYHNGQGEDGNDNPENYIYVYFWEDSE